MNSNLDARLNRKARIRKRVVGTPSRPRLSVYKSLKNIFAQVIDDSTGQTLAAATSATKPDAKKEADKKAVAKAVGRALGVQCKEKGIEQIVFDRNGFPFHGRIAAVAEGAREAGLKF